jgi:DNA topoisomerase-1
MHPFPSTFPSEMPTALVIVESPAKARTIAGYLGDGYVVESSIGHIRDLPRNAAEVPKSHKGEPWARIGIDVDNDFKPLYVVNAEKKDHVKHLKALLDEADELYLATDEDREGEAIAWHLLEVLNPPEGMAVKRMVFHEITPAAIQDAIEAPREIDRRLVDAQEARRMLDRLYGYEVSPVLWKKVMGGLSAGRVQSVATRVVVERERERMAFVRASYWDLSGTFTVSKDLETGVPNKLQASLVQVDGKKLASGRDFEQNGQLKQGSDPGATVPLDEAGATSLVEGLANTEFSVRSVQPRPYRRSPAAPFITSTFQQEAGRKLRMSSAMAMRAAQGLYEKGFITYMRTDSTTLSDTALNAARNVITDKYGKTYLPDAPRHYTKKVRNAQEAHEAIRPAGDTFKTPEEVRAAVVKSEADAYDLIWQRTVASQMNDAVGETVQVRLGGIASDGRDAEFSSSGTVISHQGFRRVYVEDTDDADSEKEDERALPPVVQGDGLNASDLSAEGHETQPPARYTEASLVKKLEELGVGRPSTYASIMGTIQGREYVWKKGSALVPSFKAFSVVGLLEKHFPDLIDYAFTANMETDLDGIATGTREAIPWLSHFYFGDDDTEGLKEKVSERLGDIDARAINSIPLGVTEAGQTIVARVGKFGPYVQREPGTPALHPDVEPGEPTPADTASIPDDIPPDELTMERAVEFLDAPGERVVGIDPASGLEVLAKSGRFGDYVQLGELIDGEDKPKTASIFKTMALETLGLEAALQLLSMPRIVGTHPEDGEEITAQNGRYGAYMRKGKDSRTLDAEELIFTITLEEAVTIYAQPKLRRGQTAKPPLKEMGDDEVSGKPMVVKDGRFGPYVTDGETNASLRKGDTVEEIDDARAMELLQLRREKGPVKKKKKATKKKSTAKKKPTKKKAPAKKKAGAKKTAAKDKPAAAAESGPDEAQTSD